MDNTFLLLRHDAASIFNKKDSISLAKKDRISLRQKFVHLNETQRVSMTEFGLRFQISRKTGYKYMQRFRAEWARGLTDRSRRPKQLHYHVPKLTPSFFWPNIASRPRSLSIVRS